MSEDAWHPARPAHDDALGLPTHGAESGVHGESRTDDLTDDQLRSIPGPGGTRGVDARAEEAPDVLRWRAEMLMDEMMVGAVDTSAGNMATPWPADYRSESAHADSAQAHAQFSSRNVEAGAEEANSASGSRVAGNGSTSNGSPIAEAARNGTAWTAPSTDIRADEPNYRPAHHPVRMPTPLNAPSRVSGEPATRNGSDTAWTTPGSSAPNFEREDSVAPAAPVATTKDPNGDAYPYAPASFASAADPLVYEAATDLSESKHGQMARAGNGAYTPAAYATSGANANPAKTPTRLRGVVEGGVGTGAPAVAAPATPVETSRYEGPRDPHPYDDETDRRLIAVEDRYPRRQPASPAYSNGSGGAHSDASYDDGGSDAPGLGPIRRNPAVLVGASVAGTVVGAMAVSSRNSKYAALLPRNAPWDVHGTEREISSLADEMARVLPSGHESSRRARHLLEKAQAIFGTDPLRSAEVDYYLSQVRAIVQRSRQTLEWSMLYRKRLAHYLDAWIVFSLVCIVGALLFAPGLTTTAATGFGWAVDGFLGQSAVVAFVAIFAGSLGGAVGALLNLGRYQRLGIGFIDRKYGLRTLVLPLMGMLAGVVAFVLVDGFLWLLGYSTANSLLVMLIPAAIAFALGVVQESIYGTRD